MMGKGELYQLAGGQLAQQASQQVSQQVTSWLFW